MLNFIDTISGYNQVPMSKEDEVKMIFIMEKDTFCFIVMPFGLQNVEVMFQRLMDNIFKHYRKIEH